MTEEVGLLGAKDGGDEVSYLGVAEDGAGGLSGHDGGQGRGGGGADGNIDLLDHSLRAELCGRDHLGGALHNGGGHLSAPERDRELGGVLRGDGGHVGAGVGHIVGHGALGHGLRGKEGVGLDRVGAATQQQLLKQAVEEGVLIHGLNNPGGDSLDIVDGGGQDV